MELQMQYDSICYRLFNAVKNLSHGADTINFCNFNAKNEEHLLLFSVTTACIGLLGEKDIAIDGSMISRIKLRNKYKKSVNVKKLNKNDEKIIDVNEVLEGLRPYACEICGLNFSYEDIYKEFYKEGDR